jgi:solute carrier family 8 (sodium/calcium exchanger)
MKYKMDLKICEAGSGGGLLLPIFGDGEQEWPQALRIILYGLGLFWCFLGVAIVADVFMGSIERITAKKVRKMNPNTKRFVTAQVWNPTVANLTLMALGSSSPEILLSVIELLGNRFYSGDLGPSCIVGSAAFNLLCITAVCIFAIPDGEFRRIKEISVYAITSFFSLFAYMWLLIILVPSSANVVTPIEGVVTFLFFPLNVVLAYLADIGYFTPASGRRLGTAVVVSQDMSKQELAQLDASVRRRYGEELTSEQVSKIIRIEQTDFQQNRAHYRIAATRNMMGGKRVKVSEEREALAQSLDGPAGELLRDQLKLRKSGGQAAGIPGGLPGKIHPIIEDEFTHKNQCIIDFVSTGYAVLENAGVVRVKVRRTGSLECSTKVQYETSDGRAKAGQDYVHVSDSLTFTPNQAEQHLDVTLIDDVAYEEDEEFFITLTDAVATDTNDIIVELGRNATTTVVIIDDDMPGVFAFTDGETLHVSEQLEDHEVEIKVCRKNGCSGRVSCSYRCEDNLALNGTDYEAVSGELVFEHNVTTAMIKVKIKAKGRYESEEDFRLIIENGKGGARFDELQDGGSERCIITVFIVSERTANDRVDRVMSALAVNWDKAKVGHSNWRDQFIEAIYVNGGQEDDAELDEDEEPPKPTVLDWIMHIICLPWKLLFALIPPTDYCSGWVCFGCSLAMIGLVTAIIGDLASLFGCCMGLPDEVTAITFVALGTSLPDTFASKTAAMQDPYADASVGNVTGSNAVNVFLGLGLPWMVGSIYWSVGNPSAEWISKYSQDPEVPLDYRGGAFVVKAGTLGFSVAVFVGCAAVCLIMLMVRRYTCQGELGGPRLPKYLSCAFSVSLWLIYISLSSWKTFSLLED